MGCHPYNHDSVNYEDAEANHIDNGILSIQIASIDYPIKFRHFGYISAHSNTMCVREEIQINEYNETHQSFWKEEFLNVLAASLLKDLWCL